MKIRSYRNPDWEPAFGEISPVLGKIYLRTRFGVVRWVCAKIILARITRLEKRR